MDEQEEETEESSPVGPACGEACEEYKINPMACVGCDKLRDIMTDPPEDEFSEWYP